MKQVFDKYSKYYDLIYQGKDYKKEEKFIEEVIKKFSPIKVENILSIGCGTCSYETILAKNGFKITGIDQSQTMLDLAQKKINEQKLKNKIKLIKADARNFRVDEKFDAVMEMFNIIGYHTTNDDLNKVLNNINKSLKINGIFFFDCWYLPAVLKDRPTDKIKEIQSEEKRIIRKTQSRLHVKKNVIEIKFTIDYIEKNKVVEKTKEIHLVRYWSLPELEYILNSNGFNMVKAGNFLDINTPPSENNWDIFIVAKKVK
ncbi:MAG: class I SAM-dependent methyltransferase [Nanoarchaeota archaeon]|nr:class I SAM-dependent methyltransferase [Nanoarchaeota archaeon]